MTKQSRRSSCTRYVSKLWVLFFYFALVLPIATYAQNSVVSQKVFSAIGVKESVTACEIGAGTGDLTVAAAKIVGVRGHVYANELGAEHLETLRGRVKAEGMPQIMVVEGSSTKTNFPAGACDAIFMNDVYHHFTNPSEMNQSIVASLRPGGRLGVIDFTPPGQEAPQPAERGNDGMHGITSETLVRELQEAGLEFVSSEVTKRVVIVMMAKPKSPPS